MIFLFSIILIYFNSEIAVIGGWVNSRVLIRRKKSDPNALQQVFVPPILTAQTPTKFILEVANSM